MIFGQVLNQSNDKSQLAVILQRNVLLLVFYA